MAKPNVPNTASRRDFVKNTAAIGAAVYVGHSKVGYAQDEKAKRSANAQVAYAAIGVDGKGKSDSADAGKHGEMVAVCDVDSTKLKRARKAFKKADQFTDFRKMFAEMGDKIDAVTVSTPDHMHAVASAMAMKADCAVYCQKPLTRTMWEARQLAKISQETGVATQMGNQGTSKTGARKGAALVQSGFLGDLKECHVVTNRPVWAQGGDRPAPTDPPANLDWDLWLGVAPSRPFADGYHPFSWRGWWDFGTGALGDMACHTFNLPYMALNLRDAVSVQGETSGHNQDSFPQSSRIKFEFPEREGAPAMPVYWYDGGNKPEESLLNGFGFKHNSGCIIVGSDYTFYSPKDYGEDWYIIDADGNEVPAPDDLEPLHGESPGHFTEFHQAITGEGPAAISNFIDYSGKLTETILLGNLAVLVDGNQKVEWDAENLTATNMTDNEAVSKLIKPDYRGDYSL